MKFKLTDVAIRNARPKNRNYKLSDGGGLHLLVTSSGGKLWRFKYRFNGKEKQLALGQYPHLSIVQARRQWEQAKALLAQGIDPSEKKREIKGIKAAEQAHTPRDKPISEGAMRTALRRIGYKSGEMTIHGFRHMASTLLNEQGYNRDWIERQLSHGDRDVIRATYNYAEYLPERRKMMQSWADYLDTLKADR